MIALRALGALLSYPSEEMRQALPEIAAALRASPLLGAREREELELLIAELAAGDLLDAEERYVALFDRGRATSLHLFEHLHGESRDRGQAMVELRRVYESAGYELSARELPDYLPVVLEYLSCRDRDETRAMLADCAELLKEIGTALIARRSAYAAILQALLAIAGEKRLDDAAIPAAASRRTEDLDEDWLDPPAFGGEPAAAPARPPR
jgi:nitrate reductase delta subunit